MTKIPRLVMIFFVLLLGLVCLSPAIMAKQQILLEWTTWHVNEPAEVLMMTDFINGFKKLNPNVDIKLTGNPWSEYFDKLQVRMAGGSYPDIFACSQDNFTRYYGLGFTEPLNRYISMSKYKGKFIDVAELVTIKNKTHGIVYLTLPFTLIYNKSILDAHGLKPPTTPEELIEVGKKLTVAGEQYGYAGSVDPSVPADFYTEILVWTIGYNGKLARKGMPTINEQQNVDAITMLKKVYDSGIMPLGVDRQLYRKMEVAGKIAMLIDGAYYFDWLLEDSEDTFKQFDSAPIFFPNKSVRTYTVYQCVSKGGKYKDIAAKFLNYMLQPENQEQFVPRVKQVPAIKDSISSAWLKANPWYHGYQEIKPASVVPEGIESYTEDMKKLIARYVGDVFISNKPVKKALDECQSAMIELLKSRGYKFPTAVK